MIRHIPSIPSNPFIVCRRRKSQPKVQPVVCEKRCPHVKRCASYRGYVQPGLFDRPQGKKSSPPGTPRTPRKTIFDADGNLPSAKK